MVNYNEIAQNNLDEIMQELAQYTRMAEEIAATVDSLKDILKKHMEENGLEVLTGNEHKATYKTVVSSRIDTADHGETVYFRVRGWKCVDCPLHYRFSVGCPCRAFENE